MKNTNQTRCEGISVCFIPKIDILSDEKISVIKVSLDEIEER